MSVPVFDLTEDAPETEASPSRMEIEDSSPADMQPLFRVDTWLESIGMNQYVQNFLKADINLDVLPHLSTRDLQGLGVLWDHERRLILEEISHIFFETKKLSHDQKRRRTLPSLKSSTGGAIQGEARKSSAGFHPQMRQASMPEWQVVPGSHFIVDRFKFLRSKDQNRSFFLTHFHSDHYNGLKSSFSHGVIYCSEVTSRLLQTKIKLPSECIKSIPLDTPTEIDGVRVTFIDANHCPGAVMIIFENLNGPPVLHTGDARLITAFHSNEKLKSLRSKKCILVLDTTYCDPAYTFPSQEYVIKYITDTVVSELYNPKTLFLFGTYGIGKEKIFLEVAKKTEKMVYMCESKMQSMRCLDLTEEEKSLLTTNHEITNLHAIAMWKIEVESMSQILKRYNGKYSNVIGFRPTGWSYEKGMEKVKCGRCQRKGKVIIHQVPYSEHSSYIEMRDFVQWLDPIRIIPSVGNDQGPKLKKMLSWLKQRSIMDHYFPRTEEY